MVGEKFDFLSSGGVCFHFWPWTRVPNPLSQGIKNEFELGQEQSESFQFFEKKPNESPQELSQVETARGQNGIRLVALVPLR